MERDTHMKNTLALVLSTVLLSTSVLAADYNSNTNSDSSSKDQIEKSTTHNSLTGNRKSTVTRKHKRHGWDKKNHEDVKKTEKTVSDDGSKVKTTIEETHK